ncbi:MAG: thiamine phosphate synthase [Candidatus Omnitrophica bacterium]|nr:thiamine phosphate synthase [Candidatus Omnitrophota bacterium]
MKSKKRLLRESRLYLILDKKTLGRRSLPAVTGKLKNSGFGVLQLRDKASSKIKVLKEAFLLSRLLAKSKTLFIINDHPDIAAICGADGVHLGQSDYSIRMARRMLGNNMIIGVSCHSFKQALQAQKNGADYIGIGPVFSTPTKPEYKPIGLKELGKLRGRIRIPYFAIGNINKSNLESLLAIGAKRAAFCRAILKSKNPARETKELKELINK